MIRQNIFSEFEEKKIERSYSGAIRNFGGCAGQFSSVLLGLGAAETLCYKFLVASMPISDATSYSGQLLLSFVKSSLLAREKTPWGKKIPTGIFLNDVLFYRVNNENIEDYRGCFFKELFPRVKGLDLSHAALEVNHWCHEKATYQSTDDRTVSPLTMAKNGRGRCGEESVLAVSALRSVGIPARQCYVPKWSHCDDNHAWVEVWVDGYWHFLGACEPEPVLDKGWFTYAATRAMLVHSRLFSNFAADGAVIAKKGCVTELNRLPNYAATGKVTARVLDETGKPLAGVSVQFEVINYAELAAIASPVTGNDGTATLETGLGDLFVSVFHGGNFLTEFIHVQKDSFVLLNFSHKGPKPVYIDYNFQPPEGKFQPCTLPERAELSECERKIKANDATRKRKENSFLTPGKAGEYAAKFPPFQKEIARFLALARGNHTEIAKFLESRHRLEDKVSLLNQLREKDFIDCTCAVLEDTLDGAMPYRESCESAVFQSYVLSPRIQDEFLFPYRRQIINFFSEKQREAFRENPALIHQYIEESVSARNDLDYEALTADPAGLLQVKAGSERSRRTLFVAICRTFGIPARFNPHTGAAEFLQAGVWKNADGSIPRKVKLTLKNRGRPLHCHQNFSIARLENDTFFTLNYSGLTIENQAVLEVEPGYYRILLANRQIDGDILARFYYLDVKEDRQAEIAERQGEIRSRLIDREIRDTALLDASGRSLRLSRTVALHPKNIISLIDVKKEPTEHLLNEFISLQERCQNDPELSILFLVPDSESRKDALLQKVLASIPNSSACQYLDPALAEKLCDEARIGDRRLPLVLLCTGSLHVRFFFSNYNVGTASLALDIAQEMTSISD